MGRAGPPGVDVRETSIRITFTFEGKQYRETLKNADGCPLEPSPPNIRRAARMVDEIRQRIRDGVFRFGDYFSAGGTGKAVTVAEQLETWLGGLRLEASTVDGYRSAAKFWTTKLGDKPLRAVRYSDLTTALASVPGLSGKTINNRVSVLREAMAVAVLDKLIDENPVDALKSASYQRPPVDPFSAEEADAIIAELFKNAPEQVGNYVEAKFYTGLRTGESFGLRWPNVDLRAKHIVVVDSVVSGEEKASTKTHTSRTVILNSRSLRAVTAQKAHSYLAGAHVFLDPRDGERWGGEPKFRFYWLGALKRLGIRHRPPYNTRHTYATMMLMAGMKPAFCAGQMGHSVDMFLRTYAKWIPGAGDQAEMALLEQRISAIPALSLNKG